MDWELLVGEGMYVLGTLIVGFLGAIVFLLTGVIAWSGDELLWFLPLCVGISYGGRVALRVAKIRTDSTHLTEVIRAIMKRFTHDNQPG